MPPRPNMQRQRSSSDPHAAIPRRVLEQDDGRPRRGSVSSLSTLIQDTPAPPDPAFTKDYGKEWMVNENIEFVDDHPPRVSPSSHATPICILNTGELPQDTTVRGRIKAFWDEYSGPLPLVEAPPSPEDPGLAYRHLHEGASDEIRDQIVDELRGHGASQRGKGWLWKLLRPSYPDWEIPEPKTRVNSDSEYPDVPNQVMPAND